MDNYEMDTFEKFLFFSLNFLPLLYPYIINFYTLLYPYVTPK